MELETKWPNFDADGLEKGREVQRLRLELVTVLPDLSYHRLPSLKRSFH